MYTACVDAAQPELPGGNGGEHTDGFQRRVLGSSRAGVDRAERGPGGEGEVHRRVLDVQGPRGAPRALHRRHTLRRLRIPYARACEPGAGGDRRWSHRLPGERPGETGENGLTDLLELEDHRVVSVWARVPRNPGPVIGLRESDVGSMG